MRNVMRDRHSKTFKSTFGQSSPTIYLRKKVAEAAAELESDEESSNSVSQTAAAATPRRILLDLEYLKSRICLLVYASVIVSIFSVDKQARRYIWDWERRPMSLVDMDQASIDAMRLASIDVSLGKL
ncbi:hypothetical protein DY000_02040040 [Brassica cretica]|uniref:3'-5' exonuclease domain-containing protein n=1 Tax=Brassica cretica TaxID=69181 RepID=A0ABQ7BQ64_BRACR|nr:hypothetical protein DY000_02040040 [Brassica cretica]